MVDFHVEAFDGPLDLLLFMIQKNDVNIYDIPVSEITAQFLDYLKYAESVSLGDLSEFYKMAADLIWIKSQMLLPRPVEFPDDYEDPREGLVQRLLEYAKYKKYTDLLLQYENNAWKLPERNETDFVPPYSDAELVPDASAENLWKVFFSLMGKRGVHEKVFNLYEEVTENEKIALMTELLERREVVRFTDLFSFHPTGMHIICSFIAVLVAVKDKIIRIRQDALFDDFEIRKRTDDELLEESTGASYEKEGEK